MRSSAAEGHAGHVPVFRPSRPTSSDSLATRHGAATGPLRNEPWYHPSPHHHTGAGRRVTDLAAQRGLGLLSQQRVGLDSRGGRDLARAWPDLKTHPRYLTYERHAPRIQRRNGWSCPTARRLLRNSGRRCNDRPERDSDRSNRKFYEQSWSALVLNRLSGAGATPRAAIGSLYVSTPTWSLPQPDPDATWTIQRENDTISKTPGAPDRYGSGGLCWTSEKAEYPTLPRAQRNHSGAAALSASYWIEPDGKCRQVLSNRMVWWCDPNAWVASVWIAPLCAGRLVKRVGQGLERGFDVAGIRPALTGGVPRAPDWICLVRLRQDQWPSGGTPRVLDERPAATLRTCTARPVARRYASGRGDDLARLSAELYPNLECSVVQEPGGHLG